MNTQKFSVTITFTDKTPCYYSSFDKKDAQTFANYYKVTSRRIALKVKDVKFETININ